LVIEISLYYDARSKIHQIMCVSLSFAVLFVNFFAATNIWRFMFEIKVEMHVKYMLSGFNEK